MLKVENPDTTIKTFKKNIQDLVDIPCDKQVVILEDKLLQDDCVLSDCDIQYSKLKLIFELGKIRT